MDSKTYPLYHSHDEAKIEGCFNCGRSLLKSEHKPSGYPSGKWDIRCDVCGMYTYYDVCEKIAVKV